VKVKDHMPQFQREQPVPVLSRQTLDSGVVVVAISGEMDTFGTKAIESAFQAALPDRTVDAVIDLKGVPFLTSAALAMLIVKAQAMRHAGGKLHLAGARKVVKQIFEQAGFNSLFPIYETLEDALDELEKKQTPPEPLDTPRP
jgi:anti-anti-sigma factor